MEKFNSEQSSRDIDQRLQIEQTLAFYHPNGNLFEVCGIGNGRSSKAIEGGFFNDHLKAVDAALNLTKRYHGVYVTINPVQVELLGRADNHTKAGLLRTQDRNVLTFQKLLVDVDPVRPSGVSSTDAEHDAALALCQKIRADLLGAGWPEPLVADSGNGGHLVYCMDIVPIIPENGDLLKLCLRALASRYNSVGDLAQRVDTTVANAGRISKIYGTWAGKGKSTPDRPHRMARIIALPETPATVSLELVRELASTVENYRSGQPAQSRGMGTSLFDLAGYLDHYSVPIKKVKEQEGFRLHVLETCLFDASHSGGEASIGQASDGKLFYQCFHNSCKERTWSDARAVISGLDKLHQWTSDLEPNRNMYKNRLENGVPNEPPKVQVLENKMKAPCEQREQGVNNCEQPVNNGEQGEGQANNPKDIQYLLREHGIDEQKALHLSEIATKTAEREFDNAYLEELCSHLVHTLSTQRSPCSRCSQEKSSDTSGLIRTWVTSAEGIFQIETMFRELGITERRAKQSASMTLIRLKQEGVIERYGEKRGQYRLIEVACSAIDWKSADNSYVDIKWPFQIEQYVNTMPGNVIVVAGEANAGKTAFLLNVVEINMHYFEMHYFSSEMGPSELRERLSHFQPKRALDDWRFHAWERSSNFGDVIKPGKGIINVIDFLEVHKDYWEVGGMIKEIHDKLDGATAIIALQKNPGSDVGLGGARGLEKPRLYLSMSNNGVCKIVKAKNWRTSENPNRMQCCYKLVQGCHFYVTKDWHRKGR